MMETIGQRVRRLRTERNMTIKEVGARAKMWPSSIGLLEHDKCGIGFFNMIEIARALDVSLDYIAYGDENGN